MITLTMHVFTLTELLIWCCDTNSQHSPTALMNCSFVARLGSPLMPLQHLVTTSSRSLCESSESSDVVEEKVDDTDEGRTGLQQVRVTCKFNEELNNTSGHSSA